MKVLGLFSGIGGWELAFQRAGFTIVACCEAAPYPQRILAKRFGVPVHPDIRTLHGLQYGPVDVITGGFPCKGHSMAGLRQGLDHPESSLWFEMHRIIQEARPKYVAIENVAALRSNGLGEVLRGLNALGYDAEWHCVPAGAVGAPHRRDRVWVLAYPNGRVQPVRAIDGEVAGTRKDATRTPAVPTQIPADPQGQRGGKPNQETPTQLFQRSRVASVRGAGWPSASGIPRVDDGVPNGVDRRTALGNALVPQIAHIVALTILQRERMLQL